MSILVVYYSRSGTTRRVAEDLARRLGADLDEIREPLGREGPGGYVRSALDAILRRWVLIAAPRRDPAKYDLVVVGTPVWAGSVSAPVRAYLATQSRALPRVAFFVTEGGRGAARVHAQMAEVASATPLATLALRQRDVDRGITESAVGAFVRTLTEWAQPGANAGNDVAVLR